MTAYRVTVSVVVGGGWCKISQDDIVHGSWINPAIAVGCRTTHVLPGVSGGVTSLTAGKAA